MKREYVITSDKKHLEMLRSVLKDIFEECGYNMTLFNRVYLGLSEAVSNSIIHGNCSIIDRSICIQFSYFQHSIVLDIQDSGSGFDYKQLADPTDPLNIKKDSGRGIFLIKSTADEVIFTDNGSRIRIKYYLK